jgi:hypothetical protein
VITIKKRAAVRHWCRLFDADRPLPVQRFRPQAQKGLDPGDQFIAVGRLGQEAVGAAIQTMAMSICEREIVLQRIRLRRK